MILLVVILSILLIGSIMGTYEANKRFRDYRKFNNDMLERRKKESYWYPKDHPLIEIHEIIMDGHYMNGKKRDRIIEIYESYCRIQIDQPCILPEEYEEYESQTANM